MQSSKRTQDVDLKMEGEEGPVFKRARTPGQGDKPALKRARRTMEEVLEENDEVTVNSMKKVLLEKQKKIEELEKEVTRRRKEHVLKVSSIEIELMDRGLVLNEQVIELQEVKDELRLSQQQTGLLEENLRVEKRAKDELSERLLEAEKKVEQSLKREQEKKEDSSKKILELEGKLQQSLKREQETKENSSKKISELEVRLEQTLKREQATKQDTSKKISEVEDKVNKTRQQFEEQRRKATALEKVNCEKNARIKELMAKIADLENTEEIRLSPKCQEEHQNSPPPTESSNLQGSQQGQQQLMLALTLAPPATPGTQQPAAKSSDELRMGREKIKSQRQEIIAKTNQIAALTLEVNRLDKAHKETVAEAESLKIQLEKKDHTNKSLSGKVRVANQENKKLRGEGQQMKRDINKLKDDVLAAYAVSAEKERHINTLLEVFAQKEQLTAKDEQVNRLMEQLEGERKAKELLERELEQLKLLEERGSGRKAEEVI